MDNHPLLNLLQKACEGLLFRSESDAELEPFVWTDGAEMTTDRLLELAGIEPETPVKTMELAGFFRAVSKAHRPQFDALAKLLKEQLSGVKVYKIGEVEMDVYIIGKTADGNWAGVKTAVVET